MEKNNVILKKAIEYIAENKEKILKEYKPEYHVIGDIGWINDPNGFSYFNGEYHLFYQYHPYKTSWGPMYWGHKKTKDFMKWESCNPILAPDEIYDRDGCFSGSAIEVDGRHVIIYTGNIDQHNSVGEEIRQIQCMAIGDGENYIKYINNPIIDSNMLPQNSCVQDFRDPKIWEHEEDYYVVIGNRNKDTNGQILLYKSKDLRKWEYVGVVFKNDGSLGKMWECPDYFEVGETEILMASPQEMTSIEYKFINDFGTIAMFGNLNYESGEFKVSSFDEIDYGLDFYAPQTLMAKDGRRIMIAWMQSWKSTIPSEQYGYAGMMTIPRELTVVNNKLIQNPVREIEEYYKNEVLYHNISICEDVQLEGISGRKIDMTIEVELQGANTLSIQLAKSKECYTKLIYDRKEKVVIFGRDNSNSNIKGKDGAEIMHSRKAPVQEKNNKIKIRILMDIFSVEVFVNDGECAMSSTIYSPLEAKEISFSADSTVIANIKKYEVIVNK